MKEKINDTCDFCFTKQEDLVNTFCPACGYPMKGSKEEQRKFFLANEKLKQKIDEAETALSQARFAMLWPSITAVVLSFGFGFPPHNIYQFLGPIVFYLLFVVLYFIVALKPFPLLILAFMILLSGILFSILHGNTLKFLLIVPGAIMLIYLNGIYSIRRAEKALEEKHAMK
jgi:hypothetical protein